jgi:hypothetical protein
MGYTSYLSDSHSLHTIVWCDRNEDEHLLVCEADHSVSTATVSNQLDCTSNQRLLEKVLEQKYLYSNGQLGSTRDRVEFGSKWHDDHWDYRATLRI